LFFVDSVAPLPFCDEAFVNESFDTIDDLEPASHSVAAPFPKARRPQLGHLLPRVARS
jgi:hypothetical protein